MKRKIVQPHIQEKSQAASDLLQDIPGYDVLPLIQMFLYALEPGSQFAYVHGRQFCNILIMDAEIEHLCLEPGSLAMGTPNFFNELAYLLLSVDPVVISCRILDVTDDPIKTQEVVGIGSEGGILQFQWLLRSMQDAVHGLFGNLFHGSVQRKAIFGSNGFQLPEY